MFAIINSVIDMCQRLAKHVFLQAKLIARDNQ